MGYHSLKAQAFKLKGRLYTFPVLSVLDSDLALFSQQLAEVVVQAPRLFNHTPVVLDLSGIQDKPIDLQQLCQCLRSHTMIPVGMQGGNVMLETQAQCLGLAVLHASSVHDKSLLDKPQESEPTLSEIKTKLLTAPVRSGQQIVSRGDLVITAAVSHGAELLADGHIHIYGALRGRALAGLSGDKQARIFCQSLEAELIAIAGFYRLSDSIEASAGPCQIFLQDDHIQIEPI